MTGAVSDGDSASSTRKHLDPFDPLSPEMLPPVRLCKYATPVKAKTSAPLPLPRTACAALTWRGLGELIRTGSRGRGRGLRQTLDRQAQQRGRLTVGRKDDSGTVWATPLGRVP
jgi:hypothetical protein